MPAADFTSSPDPQPWRRDHWVSHVERHAHEKPGAVALRFEGKTTTWLDLQDHVVALSNAFARRGVAFGDRVAIMMHNRPELIVSILATNRIGAIAVPVNFRLTPTEVAHILVDSRAVLVVADDSTSANASVALAGPAGGPGLVVATAGPLAIGERFRDLLDEIGDARPAPDVAEGSPALIMYTSGTTGRPKGAVLSHQNLQAQALTLIRAWRLFDDDEVNLCAVPLFHIGAIGSVIPLLLIGGCIVIQPTGGFSPAATLDVLEAERITSVFLVPAQWQAICDDPTLGARALPALRTICWGAAPASPALLQRLAAAFPAAVTVATFGQTEMSPVTCVLTGADALRKIGSVGRPVGTVAVRVVGPEVVDGELVDVAPGEVGEIVYRGPSAMLGYWRNPEATADAFAGGWFHSGDLVRVDPDGYYYVVDRKKDMIISGGENIYCTEVEHTLAGHPDILDVSVVGATHERWGETPVAIVVPRPGLAAHDAARLDVAALREWASGRLASYKLPTSVVLVDELPRNAAGKVLKGELRRRFGQTGQLPK